MLGPPLPEWAPHEAVWIGFPSDPELWLGDLKPAEREVAAFADAVHAGGKGEKIWLVAAHEGAAESARELCPFAQVIVEPFGDIWLRDTGPIVFGSGKERRARFWPAERPHGRTCRQPRALRCAGANRDRLRGERRP